ncbi:MAG: NosD domain-containing protein, partial [Candidatus Thorarchaeota archaeon]
MNCDSGIEVESANEVIIGNYFEWNDAGVLVNDADNCTVIDNDFRFNDAGVVTWVATNCTIVDNEFNYDGISLVGDSVQYMIHNITGNTLNDRPLYYVHSQPGISINGNYSQVIVVNCSNAVIEDQSMFLTTFGVGVFYSDFITLSNISVFTADQGIVLGHCNNATIDSCNTTDSSTDGIFLLESHNATIS